MTCGFSSNGYHSNDDFGQLVASRSISGLKKKGARVSVPFMNGSYDFSGLYGDVFFEDRTLTYVFDLIDDTPDALLDQMSRFLGWASSIDNDEIHDDDLPHYHYLGSYEGCEPAFDESGEAVTLTVTFTVYPFAIANDASEARLPVGSNHVINKSRAARITAIPDGTSRIVIGQLAQTVTGETVMNIALESGDNEITVEGSPVTIKWREEIV